MIERRVKWVSPDKYANEDGSLRIEINHLTGNWELLEDDAYSDKAKYINDILDRNNIEVQS